MEMSGKSRSTEEDFNLDFTVSEHEHTGRIGHGGSVFAVRNDDLAQQITFSIVSREKTL